MESLNHLLLVGALILLVALLLGAGTSRVGVVDSGDPLGKWYHCACGDTSPHARHCVRSHA